MNQGIHRLNSMDEDAARKELTRCCGSSRWVNEMIRRRPFHDIGTLLASADEISKALSADDWKEAFAHHPKIGDVKALREKFSSTQSWADAEQAGAGNASEHTLRALAAGNAAYEKKFGYIFIVCATGKSADEMLVLLEQRLSNDANQELAIAADEQKNITRLRLRKLPGIE